MKYSPLKTKFKRLCDVDNNLLQKLINLDFKVMTHPWSRESWVDSWKTESYLLILGYCNDGLCGYILGRWCPLSFVFDLDKIMVCSSYQGQGFGQALLDCLPEFLSKYTKNLNEDFEIFLEVDSKNQKAFEFYNNNGFVLVREVKKFYSDGSDGLILKKIVRIN